MRTAYYGRDSAILAYQTKLTALKWSFDQGMETRP